MNLPLAFASFLFFTALVPLLSCWLTRHRDNTVARTFFLADRSLPWFQIAGTLLLTSADRIGSVARGVPTTTPRRGVGPTRPRPFDEPWYPKTLLYDTGRAIDRYEYDKV